MIASMVLRLPFYFFPVRIFYSILQFFLAFVAFAVAQMSACLIFASLPKIAPQIWGPRRASVDCAAKTLRRRGHYGELPMIDSANTVFIILVFIGWLFHSGK